MDVSVIICTYNRARDLRRTLETFRDARTDGLTWELLVVDNNSKDDTKAVCDSFKGALPVRYLFEGRQGKSFALNRSISEAAAALLIFTDDDVTVTPDWILNLHAAARRHPEMSFFGGRVVPRWEHTPPRWFVENADWLWIHPHTNCGEVEAEMKINGIRFVGANFAARKAVFAEGLLYREDFGPKGYFGAENSQPGVEDHELQGRMLARGLRGWYVPNAVIYHHIGAERTTAKYVRWWYKQKGRTVNLREEVAAAPRWFGAPRYLWRDLLESAVFYGATRFTRPSRIWLQHEVRMAEKWGSICGFRSQPRVGGI
jgi:glucosyl-dolichyl phosphate glucuronosyltransferase